MLFEPEVTDEQRVTFFSLISTEPGQGPQGECWEWKGRLHNAGYGVISLNGEDVLAHRLVLFFEIGPLSECSLHRCDNPPCCRPKHLFEGTRGDNARDAKAKDRHVAGDRHGMRQHPEKARNGDTHPYAKLTAEVVRDLRRLYVSGSYTYAELTRIAGAKCCKPVSSQTVEKAIKHQTWKHI